MSILKKTIAGALTIALSVGAIGTSVMPVLAASENNIDVLQKNVEKAQEEYDAAETAYDNGAVKFLESKMCDYHKNNFTVEKYEENIKNYTTGKNADLIQELMDKRDKFFTKEDGSPDVEKRKKFKQSWITFDNLKLQATWLDELNERRANDKNEDAFKKDGETYSNAPLKLNAELIMDSMMSAMVSYYDELKNGHVLYRSKVKNTYPFGSENLALNSDDPLEGWYDMELEDYNEGHRESDWVGHYLHCMKPYDFTGFGMYGVDEEFHIKHVSTAMRSAFSENWIPTRIEETGYTSDEWLKMVNEAEAPLKKNLDEAKANLDAAKKALREVTKPDFTNADAAKEKASKIDFSKYYTFELNEKPIWRDEVRVALEKLNEAYSNDMLKQEELDALVDDLNSKISELEKQLKKHGINSLEFPKDPVVPEKPNKPGTPGTPEKPDKPGTLEKPDNQKKAEISKIVLSASKYTYNGKTHTPSVKVYNQKGKMLSADQYTVTYSYGRKNLGSYTVDVYGKGDVTGTASAKYVIAPAKMKTPSVKAGKKKLTVKWKKLGGGSQTYQIYVLKKGTKKAKYYTSTGSSKTIKKLSKKKYYYTKIRSYKKINGKTYYGSWSGTKKVKVK